MSSRAENPFRSLQENASALFSRILDRHKSRMQCAKNCSRCCSSEFSIHPGEAALVIEAFERLSAQEREEKRQQLLRSPAPRDSCAFLSEGSCTIYESRPVICRTQGAPLCTTDEKKGLKELTACPLNFDEGRSLPTSGEDWFDLNRLTELQSIAESFFEKRSGIPEPLLPLLDPDRRVPLRVLRDLLARLP
jgi:Fe-S-cluster containining protein